jgi:predicted metal-dependent hydrolase
MPRSFKKLQKHAILFLAMATLVFQTGPRTGERVSLDKKKFTFGRSSDCDCTLHHPTVSREHFYLEHNNGKLFLVDQGSGNGTFVNSERASWIELKDRDIIEAGPFVLSVEMTDSLMQAERIQSQPRHHQPRSSTTFDAVTASLYSPQFLQGIEHFNAGRYFDAHEVWEEIWLLASGDTKLFYQMLIQAAVALHHYERANARGARGLYANVIGKLERLPAVFMSIDLVDFSRQFRRALAGLMENDNEAAPTDHTHRPRIKLLGRDTDDWSL